ncbi:HET-domain-containing protein [Stipitochalara longipes BDJ]|nr:HET-domain-containing protein [Stipitochalara longipes BDJ]
MALNLETCSLTLSVERPRIPIALSFKYSLSNGEKVEEHFRLWPTRDCNTDLASIKMPTRLLELGVPHRDHLRLSITARTSNKHSYMTLSHCWGAAKFLKLTADTFQQLLEGIHLNVLPQSFQDAAMIAQTLGVRYLWIDSLCILQDSLEDWQQEASTMGDVYKGALCNIAASGSDDSNGGCFHMRNPQLVEPSILATEFSDSTNGEYHIRLEDYLQAGLHNDQTIFTRGWIVQERALPPRVVHFGRNQVFWECKTSDFCETYPSGFKLAQEGWGGWFGFSDYFSSFKTWDMGSSQSAQKNPEARVQDLYGVWAQLVGVYSRCNLTRADDKLVAISGLAKEIHKALGNKDRYLAGLWRQHLLYQLLWYRGLDGYAANTGMSARPDSYRAPSWSWASLDGKIDIDFPAPSPSMVLDFHVTLIDVHVEYVTDDSFAQVKAGYIRLCGPLLTLIIKRTTASISSKATAYDALLNGQQTEGRVYPDMDVGDANVPFLHFMPFYNSNMANSQCVGLLLQPTGVSEGQFRRCGRLSIYGEAVKVAGGPLWASIKNHDWLEYESFDGNGVYTISVI